MRGNARLLWNECCRHYYYCCCCCSRNPGSWMNRPDHPDHRLGRLDPGSRLALAARLAWMEPLILWNRRLGQQVEGYGAEAC